MMIYQLPFHHPVRLAEEVAMLDHLSRGRMEFGAGTGVTPHEFIRWNVDFNRRKDISREALDIILQAWTKESVTFKGEFFNFDEVLTSPKPYQQPHPPVWSPSRPATSPTVNSPSPSETSISARAVPRLRADGISRRTGIR